jgi:hypothetical protein
MANSIMTIKPYWHLGNWVFDDNERELDREPFIQQIPQMVDDLVAGIPGAKNGFRLLFSSTPFPGFQRILSQVKPENGGYWYRDSKTNAEGFLPPSLMKYFDKPPLKIYVRAEKSK